MKKTQPQIEPDKKIAGMLSDSQDRARKLTEIMRAHVKSDPIRNGVKTGQETVSMQVRVLKTQADMLKAASFVDGRPATAILRDLLDMYFEAKKNNPDESERERFLKAVEVHTRS